MKTTPKFLATLFCCFTFFSLTAQITAPPKIKLIRFSTGTFSRVSDIANCGDNRLFITEQTGRIWILDSMGNKSATPFLNIVNKVNAAGNEQGLLGLTFHPNYSNNKLFFVNYTSGTGSGRSNISKFTTSLNKDSAIVSSEVNILNFAQPFANHNGGDLNFGPDGFLYAGFGDGGSAGDPDNNAQKKNTFLGKVLRLDIEDSLYKIPSTNPFVGNAAYFPEIWALGLRNPWRCSFDKLTGDYWIADVGQGNWEEINFQEANSTGGKNYGWRCFEGEQLFNGIGCQAASNYEKPIARYSHGGGNCSVTGGYVYRGSKYSALYGKYIFADYCSGDYLLTQKNANGDFITTKFTNLTTSGTTTFGVDYKDELYVSVSNVIYKVVDACNGFVMSKVIQQPCGGTDGSIVLDIQGGTGTKTIAWSNGTTSANNANLLPSTYKVTVTDSEGCVLSDSSILTAVAPIKPTIDSNSITRTMTSSVAASYQWYKDGVPYSINGINQNQQSTTYNIPGFYAVHTVDANGCESISDTILIVLSSNKSNFNNNKIKIYPNPSSNKITVEAQLQNEKVQRLEIMDIEGKIILQKSVADILSNNIEVDVLKLSKGEYFIKIFTERNFYLSNFIKN